MPKMRKKTEPNKEIKAFIYQQLVEVESYLPQGTPIRVMVYEVEDRGKSEGFSIEVLARTKSGDFVALGEEKECIFEAIKNAMEQMTSRLRLLESMSQGGSERLYQIEEILGKDKVVH